MPTLVELADTHVELHARLERHLEYVVLGKVEAAIAAWQQFAALLRAHASAEDDLLMPRFVELGLESTGCTAALLDGEHRKLERAVAAGDRRVAGVSAKLDGPARLAWVRETRLLTELLDHHDQRERAAFFPALDAALSTAERDRLHAEVRQREATAG